MKRSRGPTSGRGPRGTVRRVALSALAAGALAASLPIPAAAQDAEPLRLTLEEALAYASGSNPALRRATNSTLINGAEMRRTWAETLLPTADLTLFRTTYTGNLTRRALDNFGNPIENPAAEWNYFSQTVHQLGFTWNVQGQSLFQAHARQRLTNEDRDVARLVALTGVQLEVQRLYVDVMEQQALMQAETELIEARRIDLDVAERLFSLALRTRVDVLNAELAIEEQNLALQQQRAAHERALLALRTAMGIDDERPIEVFDEPMPFFDPTTLDVGALISRALEGNPTLLQSDVRIRSAELALSEQKRAWWPALSLGLDVTRRAFEPNTSALFDPSITSNLESQFYVQFSVPVLNGVFSQTTEQQRAAIELSNQRETDREARLQIEESIRGALLELQNQFSSARLSERANEIAQEALALAREEYRLGARSFEDLRASFQQEADTRRQVITARHAFVDALLTLEEAVGSPVRGLGAAGD